MTITVYIIPHVCNMWPPKALILGVCIYQLKIYCITSEVYSKCHSHFFGVVVPLSATRGSLCITLEGRLTHVICVQSNHHVFLKAI